MTLEGSYVLRRKWSVDELRMIENYTSTTRNFLALLVWIDQLPPPGDSEAIEQLADVEVPL